MTRFPPMTRRMPAPPCTSPTVCPLRRPVMALPLAMMVVTVLLTQPGCTTLLTAGGLQEAFQDATDTPAMAAYDSASDAEGEILGDEQDTAAALSEATPVDPAAAEAALDAALAKLAATGRLSAATEDALTAAVEDAPPQDWPDIIDAFVATIEATPAPQRTVMRPVDEPTPNEASAARETPAAQLEPGSAAAGDPVAEAPATPAPEPPAEPAPEAEPPASRNLAVVNPCFASRVRGWGAVDRFDTSSFQPGQELIVYFELEDLVGDESPEGHTTRIDTSLQLVADDGRRLHEWRFEPLEETCRAPRRDYFARYVLRIPADMPAGACRLDLAVTDTVGHATAHATLPLEIAGRVQ
jgi:hypothetical protein